MVSKNMTEAIIFPEAGSIFVQSSSTTTYLLCCDIASATLVNIVVD